MTQERVRARVFGEVADDYDRFRPEYPAPLVDDVVAYAGLGSDDQFSGDDYRATGYDLRGCGQGGAGDERASTDRAALEIGAGTGKASLAFAARGLAVTAVEPDAEMAAVLGRRAAGNPNITIDISTFEDFRPQRRFPLLFSAQAWHWTDPAVRWQQAAAVLDAGGVLALFWNYSYIADPVLNEAIGAAQRAYARSVEWGSAPIDEAAIRSTWPYDEMAVQPHLADFDVRMYRRTWSLSATDYVSMLSTHSGYRMLDGPDRAAIFGALRGLLGAQLDLSVETVLYLARRTG